MSAARTRRLVFRLAPVLLVTLGAAAWISDVQQNGPWVARNLLPPTVLVALSLITLWRGDGSWTGAGWQWPLGVAGFAIPALGLSVYLHYAYAVNLNGMFSDADEPARVFRFLPAYTLVAGGIGFAIGWIVGKRV